MSRKKYIVYLGSSGFPYGMAEIQKIILISKSLILQNNDVTVISKKGVYDKKDYPNIKAVGEYQSIKYENTSGETYRQQSFIRRNLLKIKGFFNELRSLRKRKAKKELDFAILSTHNFYLVLYYCVLSRIYNFKTVLNYVEYFSAIKRKPSQMRKSINDHLFDRYAPRIVHSILPISEFLINHIHNIAPGKKYLKVPGLTDFERYDGIQKFETEKYLLFCGAAGYMEIIHFIIDAYNKVPDNTVYLYLVVNGSNEEKSRVTEYFSKTKKGKLIKMFSKLSEKELFTYYQNALALLIPLRPTFQDIARFPHKTGEYMASGNPVISTNYGEIKHYFTNNENIFLAEEYDTLKYAEIIDYVIQNQEHAKTVGLAGKKMAQHLFDYKYKSAALNSFLEEQLSENKNKTELIDI